MNIFILDRDPILAAQSQCDKHVVKMPVESVQMLCTVLSLKGTLRANLPYKPTHINHPCTRWAAQNDANSAWLVIHARALCKEYTKRYGRVHASENALDKIIHMFDVSVPIANGGFVLAMPDTYKDLDPVTSYRNFYIHEKSKFAKWNRGTSPPAWWPDHSEPAGPRRSPPYKG